MSAPTAWDPRRTRGVVATVLWLLTLLILAVTQIVAISGGWSRPLIDALIAPTYGIIQSTGGLPRWLAQALSSSPLLAPLFIALAVALLLAIAAAVIAPTAIVRRVLAPLVFVIAAIPMWFGIRSAFRAYVLFEPASLALGALWFVAALSLGMLAVWLGTGARAAGLSAMLLTAFLTVILPLLGLGMATVGVAGIVLLQAHWMQSVIIAVATVLSGLLLLRNATFRAPSGRPVVWQDSGAAPRLR